MLNNKNKVALPLFHKTFFYILLLFIWNSAAANEDDVMVNISQCMEITNTSDRIACYDALATQASDNENSSEPTLNSAQKIEPAPPATLETATEIVNSQAPKKENLPEDFGFQNNEQESNQKPEEPALLATITSLEKLPTNNWKFTLDNGQVWRQMHGERFYLRKGFQVQIFESEWGGSYRLRATESNNSSIQVKRLK